MHTEYTILLIVFLSILFPFPFRSWTRSWTQLFNTVKYSRVSRFLTVFCVSDVMSKPFGICIALTSLARRSFNEGGLIFPSYFLLLPSRLKKESRRGIPAPGGFWLIV